MIPAGSMSISVVMEANLHGISTRKVDDLVKALDADPGISKSEVSRICASLDEEVATFCDRDLSALKFPYVHLEATYCRARMNHHITSQVVAVGAAADGDREVLGFDVGDSENEGFWTAALRSLKTRKFGRRVTNRNDRQDVHRYSLLPHTLDHHALLPYAGRQVMPPRCGSAPTNPSPRMQLKALLNQPP
jgi:hypothetical protein